MFGSHHKTQNSGGLGKISAESQGFACIDFRAAPVMKMVGAIDKRANDREDRPQLPAFPAFVWHSVKTCRSNSGHESQKPTDRIRHFAAREACYAEPTITG
ncbi:hypothetical protein MHYP_G00176430 [Metynnis hypsauchen]